MDTADQNTINYAFEKLESILVEVFTN